MKDGKLAKIGGYVKGGVLIAFGIAVIALGIYGFMFTRDSIKDEGITFGPATDPAVQEHAEKWAGEPVETGSQALAFAEIMREHTLESHRRADVCGDGALPGRREPRGPGGDERRGRGREGRERPTGLERRPRHLGDGDRAHDRAQRRVHGRDALHFGIVVGIALLLAGIGFVILAYAVFGRRKGSAEAVSPRPPPGPPLAS